MTTTAQTEDALIEALRTIRACWPSLLTVCEAGPPASHIQSSDTVRSIDRCVSLRADITTLLCSWARVVVDERSLSHGLPLGTDTPGLAILLERHARWFSGHEAVHCAVDEIGDLARQVLDVVVPYRREWMRLGACPLAHHESDTVCGGTVRGYPELKLMPTCDRCGTQAVAQWWESRFFPDAQTRRLATADDLIVLVHREFGRLVKAATVKQWVKRGYICAALGPDYAPLYDERGRTLYDRGSVVYSLTLRWAAMV